MSLSQIKLGKKCHGYHTEVPEHIGRGSLRKFEHKATKTNKYLSKGGKGYHINN